MAETVHIDKTVEDVAESIEWRGHPFRLMVWEEAVLIYAAGDNGLFGSMFLTVSSRPEFNPEGLRPRKWSATVGEGKNKDEDPIKALEGAWQDHQEQIRDLEGEVRNRRAFSLLVEGGSGG